MFHLCFLDVAFANLSDIFSFTITYVTNVVSEKKKKKFL